MLLCASFASAAESVAPDASVLELKLPKGTTITVDGREYATSRVLTYRPLKAGLVTPTKIAIKLPDGTIDKREIWLEPGKRFTLTMAELDANRPKLALQAGHPNDSVTCAAFSSDGKHLLTAAENRVILWDVETGRQLRTYSIDGNNNPPIDSVCFARELVLANSSFSTNAIWNRDTGVRQTQEDMTAIWGTYSPNGESLLSQSHDGDVVLHEAISGKEIRRFQGGKAATERGSKTFGIIQRR
jgi:WD40 repeat protein